MCRSGITVTESLIEAINQNSVKSVVDENLKHWLDIVSTTSLGHKVEAPNGLINSLTLISSYGPIGIWYIIIKKNIPFKDWPILHFKCVTYTYYTFVGNV